MILVPAFIIYQKSTEHVYENHPALYILAFGLVAAKVTNRLVVSIQKVHQLVFFLIILKEYLNCRWLQYLDITNQDDIKKTQI